MRWMPRAATAQAWAQRGREFEPELQISGQDVDGVLAALLRAIPAPR
jgi:hypothetical protein